jgi:GNAT superfamily N-acetyltransferase
VSARRSIVAVSPSLLPPAAALVERVLRGTHYLAGALDALRSVVEAPGVEGRALASMMDHDMEGVIVFGSFGGTSGAGRLHFVVVENRTRRTGVARVLASEALESLAEAGARFVLAELPDDPHELTGSHEFLEALEFAEESRMDDFFRDGIALVFMRRELSRH